MLTQIELARLARVYERRARSKKDKEIAAQLWSVARNYEVQSSTLTRPPKRVDQRRYKVVAVRTTNKIDIVVIPSVVPALPAAAPPQPVFAERA